MPISVQLDKATEALPEETAKALGSSKAQVIKESLAEYCPKALAGKRKSSYELVRDLAGRHGSGRGDLGMRSEEILRESLGRKKRCWPTPGRLSPSLTATIAITLCACRH